VQWQCRELRLARFLLLFVLPCCCCIRLGLGLLFCDYFVFFLLRRLFFRFLGLFSPFALLRLFVFFLCPTDISIYIYIGEFFTLWREKPLELFACKWNLKKKNWLKLWNHSPKIRNHKIEKEKKSYCGL
jgi:hypothetical protein